MGGKRKPHPYWATPTELAQLARCEKQFVYTCTQGKRDNPATARRRAEGDAEHIRHDREVRRYATHPADRRCFIATSVYGADAYETGLLRKYRDEHLLPYPIGRGLVKLYYRIGPVLAAVSDRSRNVRRFVKYMLDEVVVPWVQKRLSSSL